MTKEKTRVYLDVEFNTKKNDKGEVISKKIIQIAAIAYNDNQQLGWFKVTVNPREELTKEALEKGSRPAAVAMGMSMFSAANSLSAFLKMYKTDEVHEWREDGFGLLQEVVKQSQGFEKALDYKTSDVKKEFKFWMSKLHQPLLFKRIDLSSACDWVQVCRLGSIDDALDDARTIAMLHDTINGKNMWSQKAVFLRKLKSGCEGEYRDRANRLIL